MRNFSEIVVQLIHMFTKTFHSSSMIVFFFQLIISVASIFLTEDNYSLYLNDHKPLIAILKSEHCHHCILSRHVFKEVSEYYDNNDKIWVSIIDCDDSKKLCKKFPDHAFPSVYWVNDTIENAQKYMNAFKTNEIISFINKKYSPTILDVETVGDFNNYVNIYFNYSLFIFDGKCDNKILFDSIMYSSHNLSNFPCCFLRILYHSEFGDCFFFNSCPISQKKMFYQGNYNFNDISTFIYNYSIPKISFLSSNMIHHAISLNSKILLFVNEDSLYFDTFLTIIDKIPDELRIGVLSCIEYREICIKFYVPNSIGSHFMMYYPRKDIRWLFDEELNNDNLLKWIDKVLDNKVRGFGGGVGFSGHILFLFSKSKKAGFIPVFIFGLILTIITFLVMYGIIDRMRSIQASRKYD